MANKPGSSTGSGRGVLGGGTADKIGRTPRAQAHGDGRQLPTDYLFRKTPAPKGLGPKRTKKGL